MTLPCQPVASWGWPGLTIERLKWASPQAAAGESHCTDASVLQPINMIWKRHIKVEEPKRLSLLLWIYGFSSLVKTWCLQYPQCNSAGNGLQPNEMVWLEMTLWALRSGKLTCFNSVNPRGDQGTWPKAWVKVKPSPKCNPGFFCEYLWVKSSFKSRITIKEGLLIFTILWFSAQTHFQWECMGHFYACIEIAHFKTLRRLDTTWNFARSITRVSTHSSTEPHALYPGCWSPSTSRLELTWVVRKTVFLVNSVYTINVLSARVHV